MPDQPFDYVCLFHGKKMSEHHCLYCCMCFKTMTVEECSLNDEGKKQDVCVKCCEEEKKAAQQKSGST